MAGNRVSTTLDSVHKKLALAVAGAGIVDPSRVLVVMEDTQVATTQPVAQNFITVRLPSLTQQYGDVFGGGGLISSLDVLGQSRVTLWLNNDLDLYGTARKLMNEAAAAPPFGDRLLGNLVKLFWDQDLMDQSPWVTSYTKDTQFSTTPYVFAGDLILKRPLRFVSLELPPDTQKGPHPFRITWELCFSWDLSSGG